MPRRNETPAEREARDRLKQRYDAELSAITDFFTRERRIEGLRGDIATLEAEQADAVAKLVVATSVARGADTIGWSQSRVREAVSPPRVVEDSDGVSSAAADRATESSDS